MLSFPKIQSLVIEVPTSKTDVRKSSTRIVSVPIEIWQYIFSFPLSLRTVVTCSLVCKVFYQVSSDLSLPCYRWIFESSFVKSLEMAKGDRSVIEYKQEQAHATSTDAVMRLYAYPNNFHRFLSGLVYEQGCVRLDNQMIINLILAVQQGSQQARKIIKRKMIPFLIKICPEHQYLHWLAQNGFEGAIQHFLNIYKDDRWFAFAKKHAFKGSSCATRRLLLVYIKGGGNLNPNDEHVQKEGFRLTQELAIKRNPTAIEIYLKAYRKGYFGLKPSSENVQEEGFKLIESFIEEGFGIARKILLKWYLKLDSKWPEGLNLTKKFAYQGCEYSQKVLIKAYKYGYFGLKQDSPDVQTEGLKIIQELANLGYTFPIVALLNAYQKGDFGLDPTDQDVQEKEQTYKNLFAKQYEFVREEILLRLLRDQKFDEAEKVAQEFKEYGSECARLLILCQNVVKNKNKCEYLLSLILFPKYGYSTQYFCKNNAPYIDKAIALAKQYINGKLDFECVIYFLLDCLNVKKDPDFFQTMIDYIKQGSKAATAYFVINFQWNQEAPKSPSSVNEMVSNEDSLNSN